jgi:hypothetical protein
MLDFAGDGYFCHDSPAYAADLELPPDQKGSAGETRPGDWRPEFHLLPGNTEWFHSSGLRHRGVLGQLQLRHQHDMVAR